MIFLGDCPELDKKINAMINTFLGNDGWVCMECGLGQDKENKRMSQLIKLLLSELLKETPDICEDK